MFTDVDVRGVPRGRCNREKCECDGFTRSSAETSVGGSGAAQWGWCCYCGHPPVCHARIERKVFDDGDTTLDSEHHAQSPPLDPPTHHEHIEVAQPRTDVHVLDPTEETPRSTEPENNGQENSVSPAGKAHLCTPVHSSGQKRVHSDEDTSDSDTSTSEKRVLLQKVANLEDDMRNLKRRLVDEQPVPSESSSKGASEQENNIQVSQSRAYFTPHLKHRCLPKDHCDQKLASTSQKWQGSSVPLSKPVRPRRPRKSGNSSFQMKALQMLAEIRTEQLVQSEAAQRIENALSNLAPAILAPDSCNSTILKLLPLDSQCSLEKMEAELLIPKNRSDLVSYLSTIGGYSAKDCLRRIMRRIMADQLAQLYSFTGKKGKEPFAALRLLGVVIGAIRKTYLDITDADVQALVAEWLRYAPARLSRNRTVSSAQASVEPDA